MPLYESEYLHVISFNRAFQLDQHRVAVAIFRFW
ncbi:Uncharacterised protein [Vibrio cholerae]|nr:Uncharacterised protein [Vibrio cholerae]